MALEQEAQRNPRGDHTTHRARRRVPGFGRSELQLERDDLRSKFNSRVREGVETRWRKTKSVVTSSPELVTRDPLMALVLPDFGVRSSSVC